MYDYKQRPNTKEWNAHYDSIFRKKEMRTSDELRHLHTKIDNMEKLGYSCTWHTGSGDELWCVITDGNGKEVSRGWNIIEAYEKLFGDKDE
jgi:hypothetical protein